MSGLYQRKKSLYVIAYACFILAILLNLFAGILENLVVSIVVTGISLVLYLVTIITFERAYGAGRRDLLKTLLTVLATVAILNLLFP